MAGGQMQRVSDGDVARGAQQLEPGTALVRSGTAYQTAVTVQVKRDLGTLEKLGGRVLARCEVEAALLGEEFFYGWDVRDGDSGKKKRIGGVSIDGAMMLLRNWGNAAVEVELLETTQNYYLLKAILIDLETGATTPRLYRKHRSRAPGSMEQQRWDDMTFSDGQSRAIRNVITHALPQWLQKRCMDAAQLAAAKNIDPDHELAEIRDRAKAVGIDAKRIEAKLGKDFDKWSTDDFVQLRAMFRAIEEDEPKDRNAKALLVFALPADTNTMAADKKDESLVDKFSKRMRAAWNREDLEEVVKVVKAAADDGKLGEADMIALRQVYAEKKKAEATADKKSERGSASPGDPNDDAREP